MFRDCVSNSMVHINSQSFQDVTVISYSWMGG